MSPIILRLLIGAVLYAIGFAGMHLLHLPQDEVDTIDKDAEHIIIDAIEAEL